jgi:hypothetical protein
LLSLEQDALYGQRLNEIVLRVNVCGGEESARLVHGDLAVSGGRVVVGSLVWVVESEKEQTEKQDNLE